jgi:thymidylate kinase
VSQPWEAWAATYSTIVVEGCDGVGKTTLCDLLAARHCFPVVHSGRSPEGTDLVSRYHGILAIAGKLVLDRSFVSELVYGPIFRDRSRLTLADAVGLAIAVAQRRGVLVHVRASPETIYERLNARGGNVWQLSVIRQIQDQYRRVFDRLAWHVPTVLYDTDPAT